MAGYRALSALLARWTGTIKGFVREIDRQGVHYITYSKVASLDFCPYRYFLEFVRRVNLRPQPSYFLKGTLFHQAVAEMYRRRGRGCQIEISSLLDSVEREGNGPCRHLQNALQTAIENVFEGWEIVGVEQPFVLSLSRSLPPCIGVVDLILRQGSDYAVVDHKTGNAFYDPDELQLAIYREYVQRRYKTTECRTFIDQYRWVNDLGRVRKPAFRRLEIRLGRNAWSKALHRLRAAYEEMQQIEARRDAAAGERCYMCPFAEKCRLSHRRVDPWRDFVPARPTGLQRRIPGKRPRRRPIRREPYRHS